MMGWQNTQQHTQKTTPKGDESKADGSFSLSPSFSGVKAGQRLMKGKVHKLCGELS